MVLQKNLEANTRIIVNQGGTRSSKTYSIAQKHIIRLHQTSGKTLTIARKTFPSLQASVMRDFFEILRDNGLYDEALHNRSVHTYKLNGNLVEFVSLDMPQKKRGTKRDYLWLNEANEFTLEDYTQLSIRTTETIDLDYNPSDEFHWIYEQLLDNPKRTDVTFIKSTYLDNTFLDSRLVSEIEYLRSVDENYWRVYGLGERGQSKSIIYSNWDQVEEFSESIDETVYGLDFGYTHPSVLVEHGIKEDDVYIDELLYETNLTNQDLITRLLDLIPEEKRHCVLKCDCAEPDRIMEIHRAGFNAQPCRKGKHSVRDSIDVVKRKKLHITSRSLNYIKEIKIYKWKEDKDGHILKEPLEFRDDAMAATRYAIGDILDDRPNIHII